MRDYSVLRLAWYSLDMLSVACRVQDNNAKRGETTEETVEAHQMTASGHGEDSFELHTTVAQHHSNLEGILDVQVWFPSQIPSCCDCVLCPVSGVPG
jgi:hypothetical protein